MIIQLNKPEISILLLHMSITRDKIKKGFKRNYKSNHKEKLNSYDDVKNALANEIEQLEQMNENELIMFNFNINEINMLSSFLNWYATNLESLLKSSNKYIGEDKMQVETLKNINTKVQRSIEVQYA